MPVSRPPGIERRDGFIEASGKTDARFFRAGRARQWPQALAPAQVARIVERHRAQTARFRNLPATTR